MYDVIAKIRGSQEPDRWIIRGNHHDGWVFGATDPLAGQVALMAEAKAIGTIGQGRLAAAPHLGLCQLGRRGAGTAGLDRMGRAACRRTQGQGGAVRQFRYQWPRLISGVSGSHALQHFVSEAARDVKDPETGASVSGAGAGEGRVDELRIGRRVRSAAWQFKRRFAARRARLGFGLTRRSCSTWA